MSFYTIFMATLLLVVIRINKFCDVRYMHKYTVYGILILMGSFMEFLLKDVYSFRYVTIGVCIILLCYVMYQIVEVKARYQVSYLQLILIVLFLGLVILIDIFCDFYKISWIVITIAGVFMYINILICNSILDGLTGLLNQKSFKNYEPYKMCMIIIFDINDFKYINDNYGHQFGDNVIKKTSEILKETYGRFGKCFRIGGDEFAVILEEKILYMDLLNKQFIEAIQNSREEMPELPNISFGSSMYIPNEVSFEEAVKYADIEMYQYKKKSKSKK